MKKILIGWEGGQGLGHLAIVAPIAKRLAWLGHEVVFVLEDLEGTRSLWEPIGRGVQAPTWHLWHVVGRGVRLDGLQSRESPRVPARRLPHPIPTHRPGLLPWN